MNYLSQAEDVLEHVKIMDVDTAYEIARRFHQENEVIRFKGQEKLFRQVCAGLAPGFRANMVLIEFYGGPVGCGSWHKGTLCSYVYDFVASKIQMEGLKTAIRLLQVRV
jgi:hypothetical protein